MVSRPPASAALQRPGQGPQAAVSPAGRGTGLGWGHPAGEPAAASHVMKVAYVFQSQTHLPPAQWLLLSLVEWSLSAEAADG